MSSSREEVARELDVRGDLTRAETRRRVIEAFLEENPGRAHKYSYLVETFSDGSRMLLRRPTRRFDFDFKVIVEGWEGRGSHDEVYEDLRRKKQENPGQFESLMKAVKDVHSCRDVDGLLREYELDFQEGWSVELLLKLLKWYFILEDIFYWNYKGRNALMDAIQREVK